MKRIIAILVLLLFTFQFVYAQANNAPLKNKHTINFNMGFKGNSKTSVSAMPTVVDVKSGFTGGIDYGYWFNNEWQVGLNISVVEASADVNTLTVKSNAVVSFLFGLKYYPEGMKLGDVGRCYAGLYAGPVVGFVNREKGIMPVAESTTETVVGGQVLAGVDLFIAKWFKLGPAVNYNFMADLTEVTGEKKNFGGFGFVFNFGFVF